jgi:hypothetical protein
MGTKQTLQCGPRGEGWRARPEFRRAGGGSAGEVAGYDQELTPGSLVDRVGAEMAPASTDGEATEAPPLQLEIRRGSGDN